MYAAKATLDTSNSAAPVVAPTINESHRNGFAGENRYKNQNRAAVAVKLAIPVSAIVAGWKYCDAAGNSDLNVTNICFVDGRAIKNPCASASVYAATIRMKNNADVASVMAISISLP